MDQQLETVDSKPIQSRAHAIKEVSPDVQAGQASAGKAPSSKKKPSKKKILAIVGAVVVAVSGYVGYTSYMYVSTDNATVGGKATFLSARVGGLIVEAHVDENQSVKAGQVIAKIRPFEYENLLSQAESERAALAAQVKGAERSYHRMQTLLKQGAAPREKFDAIEAEYNALKGRLSAAEAQVSQARQNLEDTTIKAPSDGKIARKSFEVGMMASPGQPLVGFVEGQDRWVTANFKETEMKDLVPGKKAEVEVDAIPGRKFEGVVESISPSTGATFSLLPPDNATGNFTKVVQRVPVRIKLVNLSEGDVNLLQAGLSSEVSVKLH